MSVKTARLWSILGKVVKLLSEHINLEIKSISGSNSYVLFDKVLNLVKYGLKKPKKCYRISGLSHLTERAHFLQTWDSVQLCPGTGEVAAEISC